ncbi:restriction endonuclease subunit S [Mucilaginibacter antarcticus]|uniref:restriction endonuclease subunit S n=1 Tax=Mucilaginibacter antarcticus TaxID=1855725 RepID=UPI003642287F
MIQVLFTGKKRLLGFENREWIKLNANLIFKSVSNKNNGAEQLLSATQEFGIIPRNMLEARVTMPSGDTGSFKLVNKSDFVISLRSFQGGIEYSNYRGLVSPAYTVLKPILPIVDEFYKHYFKSYDFIGHLAVAVIGIRDGKQVSYEDFSLLKLPYPDVGEQKAIAEIIEKAVYEVNLYEKKLAQLQLEKKGLMQKLLTGEIRVKN